MMKSRSLHLAILVAAAGCLPAIGYTSSGNHNAFGNLMKAGRSALRQQQWGAAVTYFRNAIGWERRSAEAHVGLGMAYLHLAQVQRAGDEFHAAQRIDRNNAQAEYGLRATHSPDELEKEFAELAEQVKSHPNDAALRARYAEDLIDRGRFDEAQKEAEAALKVKPKLGEAFYVLGSVALHNGNNDEARKNFLVAVKADKRDDNSWGGLGDLAMKEKDYPAAIANYQHAAAIVPDEQQWHEKLRDAYKAAGNAQGAEQQQTLLDSLTRPVPAPSK